MRQLIDGKNVRPTKAKPEANGRIICRAPANYTQQVELTNPVKTAGKAKANAKKYFTQSRKPVTMLSLLGDTK